MWVIVTVCAIASAIIFMTFFFNEQGERGFGFLAGALGGATVSILIMLAISGIFYSINSVYSTTEETYELTPYIVDDKSYYVYISNKNNIELSVQYYDEDGAPKDLHIYNNFDVSYHKGVTPKVVIASTQAPDSFWLLDFNNRTVYYKITLADKAQIYQHFGQKGFE